MTVVQSILDFLKRLLSWWFVVQPWEQSVRVRFGKNVQLMKAGVHFRIPFFDIVYTQNVRRRTNAIPIQTLTTHDGKSLTTQGSLGYKIVDVLKLHQSLHDADSTIKQYVQGLVADYVSKHELRDCTPENVVAAVRAQLNLDRYGLGDVEFFLTGYVSNVRTYRLIQDSMMYPWAYGEELSTKKSDALSFEGK